MSWWVEMIADNQEDLIDAITEHKYIPEVAKGTIITFIGALDPNRMEGNAIHLKTEGHIGAAGTSDNFTRFTVETKLVQKVLSKPV